ncbi:hypothetical protein [Rubellimicrobium aerolatum]|uniref:Adenylosuccinate lyase n=1 Tax=Rubellimicrobium aerolatum TaxID=490979 RepID=A0ABW0SBJ1_9RHOB|nr:hypothetical protein [Rubellimicrobium aerolatum]MBP1805537.1 hypothetical protein [Rubellimicrobium aerolatum]
MTRLLLAAALLVLPLSARAACSGHSDQQAMTCAQGTTWDRESATCVPVTG